MAISKVRLIGELNEVNKAINTDWFASNLTPNVQQEGSEVLKWMFSISVNTATVVTVLVDTPGEVTSYKFNAGTACVADTLYTMEIPITNTVTGVNIQHATTTQDVNCVAMELREWDSLAYVATP
jgi:hypothetical protein